MKDLITKIAQALVDQPEHVLVVEIEGTHSSIKERLPFEKIWVVHVNAPLL
jgi:predicted RNA-binding protein YlqC (UPF0109 family)